MESMNQFLLLEGVDGSGKTTIGKKWAQTNSGLYIKTPGEEYEIIRDYIDNETTPETKLLFYLCSVFDASKKIEENLMYKSVVCDRYFWSSLIMYAVYYDKDFAEIEQIWKPITKNLIKPHHTILIQVNEEEQLNRLKIKGEINHSISDKLCFNSHLRKKVHQLYEMVSEREKWIKIDTTNKSPDDVLYEIDKNCSLDALV